MTGLNAPWERQELRDTLANSVVTVTFTKADGNVRSMLCTTNGPLIFSAESANIANSNDAVELAKKHTKPTYFKNNSEVQAVWDLEKAAWRSFRYDTVMATMVHR